MGDTTNEKSMTYKISKIFNIHLQNDILAKKAIQFSRMTKELKQVFRKVKFSIAKQEIDEAINTAKRT